MIAFIDDHRAAYGVEPICRELPVAPSACHPHAARRAASSKAYARARRDAVLLSHVRRVWEKNFRNYGVRKVWRQLCHKGIEVARCTVARLMRQMDLRGIVRGKSVRPTIGNKAAPCPLDRVSRSFKVLASNRLWVCGFIYAAAWASFAYVAFVIDAYAKRTVGWRVSQTLEAGFALDALEQALQARQPIRGAGLVHHSDRGVQCLSIRYTERLAKAGIAPSVGSAGGSFDNALGPRRWSASSGPR